MTRRSPFRVPAALTSAATALVILSGCMTVHGEKSPVTFFSVGNLCLTAVHNGSELSAESRRELCRITHELSRTYPQLETAHVNH